MIVRNSAILSLILALIGLTCSHCSLAQGVPPTVQSKIDSMQSWIHQEAEAGRAIDPMELEKWNRKIRAEQDRVMSMAESERVQWEKTQDKKAELKTFSGMPGTTFTVPAGKAWHIRKVSCSSGIGDYQILVQSLTFPETLQSGEMLHTPGFTAEASLVAEDQSEIIYTFDILEVDLE